MQQTTRPVSKLKVLLLWFLLIGNLVFWVCFWTLRHRSGTAPATGDADLGAFRSVLMFVVGGFFLAAGLGSYFIIVATTCLTFDFRNPVFASYKGKQYLAKIVVPALTSIGLGLIFFAVLEPVLRNFGVSGQLVFLLPFFLALIPLQIAQMWVSVWVPVVRKLITKRLAARGIHADQVKSSILMGISDPAKSSFKKMTLIEDDIGALWITPDQLIYWGDTDQFAIHHDQLIELERRADAGSTAILAGTAQIILHVRQPGGTVRQIRLHAEGHWTLGQNRKATDALAETIANWHNASRPTLPPPIPIS